MNWFNKLPKSTRSATGVEWRLWRKLPLIALAGTALPLIALGLAYLVMDDPASAAQARWLQMAQYLVLAVVIFHWSMVLTVAIGCIIVMVMKGPGYVADGYNVSHSDQPRAHAQTEQEASENRAATPVNGPRQ